MSLRIHRTMHIMLTMKNIKSWVLLAGTFLFLGLPNKAFSQCDAQFVYNKKCKRVEFINQSIENAGMTVVYLWNFGDNTVDQRKNVVHTYQSPGTYTVLLVMTEVDTARKVTCRDSMIQVITIDSTCCQAAFFSRLQQEDSQSVTYDFFSLSKDFTHIHYRFGDGDDAYTPNASHRYIRQQSDQIHQVCLDVWDSLTGCRDTVCDQVLIPANPCYADAGFTQNVDTMNQIVDFIANINTAAVNHHWDFGDGDTSTDSDPTHQYKGFGTYTVTHWVEQTDSIRYEFCNDTVSQTIEIPRPPSCQALFVPAVDTNFKYKLFIVNMSSGIGPLEYLWDMGDGTQYHSKNPGHRYQKFGAYHITLTVTGSDSCVSTYSDTVGMDSTGKLLKAEGFEVIVIDRSVIGIEQEPKEELIVYPNPFSERIFIKEKSRLEADQVELYDLTGRKQQVLIERDDGQLVMSTSSLKQGVYMLRISRSDGMEIRRLIKRNE